MGKKPDNRELIVRALRTLLSEAVEYRVYKLDVRSFFESFEGTQVIDRLKRCRVSGPTLSVIDHLLTNHKSRSYFGLPRGLSISSTLSEVMMETFDAYVLQHRQVFFYRRYVDDLTLVTSARENSSEFLQELEGRLPTGLQFKTGKKRCEFQVKPFKKRNMKASNTPTHKSFDYLGYEFNVTIDGHRPNGLGVRDVWLDIAESKVSKIKSRLLACFRDYIRTKDFQLLEGRIRHLTSNLSMLDRSKGVRRLVGIHFNYPQIDLTKSKSLHELDHFLKNALASRKGRIYGRIADELIPAQKTALAKYSFFRGAHDRKFYQLSLQKLGRVQRCWKHAN